MTERADEICAEAMEQAGEHNCEITATTEIGRPARGILKYAGDNEIEHIIMGCHGREGVSTASIAVGSSGWGATDSSRATCVGFILLKR